MAVFDGFQKIEKGFDFGQAVAEANRCLLCYDSPCSKGCPAGTDPGTFIRKLRLRNITGAIRTIKKNNILGGTCGFLCPSECLCEKECSATEIDRPIRIAKLQRFLIEHSYKIGFNAIEKCSPRAEKIAVIGSGTAGLSCAGELAKEGFKVTVFERMKEPGGALRYSIPLYRLSRDIFEKEVEDIINLGVEFRCSSEIKGEAKNFLDEGFSAVFFAPGLWQPIGLDGEPKPEKGVLSSIYFLTSLRDEKFDEMAKYIKGKTVAVLGGGSVSMDCAESVLKLNPKDVYLIYRRSYREMPATDKEKITALNAGVHFLFLNKPKGYKFNSYGNIEAVELVRTTLGRPDSSQRRSPVEIPDSKWALNVDTVIEAIGLKADNSIQCYPNNDGLIIADSKTNETSLKGIFAGGDIIRGPSLVIEAVKDGKQAARAIMEQLVLRGVAK